MAFKKPRLNHYGIHKDQVIIQNGISQLSPLDRKQLPLDQQKQLSLVMSSDDRDGATATPPSSSTDCVINFVDGVRAVYAYRVLTFSFLNAFYSIQEGLNDKLQVIWTTAPTLTTGDNFIEVNEGIITLQEGYYKFSSEPADWVNPLASTQSDLNNLLYANINTYKQYYPNDIRVALMIRGLGTIQTIVTDRKTKQITLTWNAGLLPSIDSSSSNLLDNLGLAADSNGAIWTGISPVYCGGPTSIALVSDILNNSELIDPEGPNEFFMHVPVEKKQGEVQIYSPSLPPLVSLNSQVAIIRVPFRIVDHKTLKTLKGIGVNWQLLLAVYSTDVSPAI